ncbi:cytochrome c family protein [Sphingomonas sp. 1P06PA]|uniref:c-type cytochrome n=1 Tax=Sphingomonas sp. 1P06PA TaxID=554121 RepID=UPI0039A5DACE
MPGMKSIGATAGMVTLALLSACSSPKQPESEAADTTAATTTTAAANTSEAAPAATPAAGATAAPAADSTDTLSGATFASFTGDAASGEKVFVQCKTCHSPEAGQNRIGPSLHAIVGRAAGTVANYTYSPANKNSGITWSEAKLFQYLENPQRVVPGTKMTFAGVKDDQKRADVIAYLKTLS